MFGKFFKYLMLDKDGRETWDQIQKAKKIQAHRHQEGDMPAPAIPILNTPFKARPGDSGLIFPDSNPEEQINLIEMAIGEARKIETDALKQLPAPDSSTQAAKKKSILTKGTAPRRQQMIDMTIGNEQSPAEKLNKKLSNKKIEAIYEAMKIYHAKQNALDGLDAEARKKLRIMANVMMGNKS